MSEKKEEIIKPQQRLDIPNFQILSRTEHIAVSESDLRTV